MWKTVIEILQNLIWVMNISRIFVEKHGNIKIILVFLLLVRKRKVKVNVVSVTKTRTLLLNVFQKTFFFKSCTEMGCFIHLKKDVMKVLEELADLESKLKQVSLEQKLVEPGYQYDTNDPFEPIAKAVKGTSEGLVREIKSTAKAIEALSQP